MAPGLLARHRRRVVAASAAVLVAIVAVVAVSLGLTGGSDDSTPTASPTTERPETSGEEVLDTRESSRLAPTTEPPALAPTSTTTTTTPTGEFAFASGDAEVVGEGPLQRYTVEVEEGTGVGVDEFAEEVDAILADPRGWATADGIALQRVAGSEQAELTVRLSTPDTTDELCFPLDTGGEVSCGHRGMAVLNLERWLEGAEPSKLDLTDYRAYLVAHEFGHLLGYQHVSCPGPGELAPTMMQQTLGIGACEPNPWPAPDVE
jgi:hypothetical protein